MSKIGELAFEKEQEEKAFAMEEAEYEKELSDQEELQKRMAEADDVKRDELKEYNREEV